MVVLTVLALTLLFQWVTGGWEDENNNFKIF